MSRAWYSNKSTVISVHIGMGNRSSLRPLDSPIRPETAVSGGFCLVLDYRDWGHLDQELFHADAAKVNLSGLAISLAGDGDNLALAKVRVHHELPDF
jgi:hypothetical protein